MFCLGVITNIPSGMVTDQFGMIGLLTFIRAAETEPNLVTLALGRYATMLLVFPFETKIVMLLITSVMF